MAAGASFLRCRFASANTGANHTLLDGPQNLVDDVSQELAVEVAATVFHSQEEDQVRLVPAKIRVGGCAEKAPPSDREVVSGSRLRCCVAG